MLFFALWLLFAGSAMLLYGANIASENYNPVTCIRHTWRRRDETGWLPEGCEDFERIKRAPLTCASCGLVVRENTFQTKGD